ncbi:hypothetical protein EV291_123105 [Rhizobium sp. BK068]|nr:hypothetical protein EV291_123105 [Rhizobium sp. BK068]
MPASETRAQISLLVRILPLVAQEAVFALKAPLTGRWNRLSAS